MDNYIDENLKSIKKFLTHKKIKDCIQPTIEAFDSLVSGSPLGVLSSAAKVIYNFKEQKLIAQLMEFFININSGLTDDEYKQYIKNMNKKQFDKEIYRVMLCLDYHFELLQAKILSKIFLDLVFGRINSERFYELSDINRRMICTDYKVLKQIAILGNEKVYYENPGECSRLEALGLISSKDAIKQSTGKYLISFSGYVSITENGELLKKYFEETLDK